MNKLPWTEEFIKKIENLIDAKINTKNRHMFPDSYYERVGECRRDLIKFIEEEVFYTECNKSEPSLKAYGNFPTGNGLSD